MPAPVLVIEVEVGRTLPVLRAQRADGERYRAAHVIVRDGGVPIGARRVAVGAEPLGAAELAEQLAGLWHAGPAQLIRRPPQPAPTISVVVPSAMRRPEHLTRCIDRLADLDYPAFEVIVVDNRPVDTTERRRLHARLSAHPRVQVVSEAVPGSSAARNRGIAAASGEIVAFTDDDITVDLYWLTAIAHRFAADPKIDCVTGWVFPAELETEAQVWFENSGSTIGADFAVRTYQCTVHDRYVAQVFFDDNRPGEQVPIFRGVFGGSGNLAVRASVLAEHGGFHPALGAGTVAGGGEDIEFLSRLLRLGHRVTMDPAMAVFHHHRREYAELCTQMFGYGTGYTAALTAMITSDIRHLTGLLRLFSAYARIAQRRAQARTPVRYPSRLRWIERWGLLCGPQAYLRSRLRLARWQRRARSGSPSLEYTPGNVS